MAADIMKLLQQAQQMQGRLQQIQEELQHRTVSAASGGGMVAVEADGKGQLRSIKIDPSLVGGGDVE
ncbi:MAG TPA: YbaB/EbfC family nucleoid-associated protein, partial [Gemmatimonadaceae bacterium]|nr:YbaB/EbfC family nucleoid-associated protein [Gemmatimonadaceae bacterium]